MPAALGVFECRAIRRQRACLCGRETRYTWAKAWVLHMRGRRQHHRPSSNCHRSQLQHPRERRGRNLCPTGFHPEWGRCRSHDLSLIIRCRHVWHQHGGSYPLGTEYAFRPPESFFSLTVAAGFGQRFPKLAAGLVSARTGARPFFWAALPMTWRRCGQAKVYFVEGIRLLRRPW